MSLCLFFCTGSESGTWMFVFLHWQAAARPIPGTEHFGGCLHRVFVGQLSAIQLVTCMSCFFDNAASECSRDSCCSMTSSGITTVRGRHNFTKEWCCLDTYVPALHVFVHLVSVNLRFRVPDGIPETRETRPSLYAYFTPINQRDIARSSRHQLYVYLVSNLFVAVVGDYGLRCCCFM